MECHQFVPLRNIRAECGDAFLWSQVLKKLRQEHHCDEFRSILDYISYMLGKIPMPLPSVLLFYRCDKNIMTKAI